MTDNIAQMQLKILKIKEEIRVKKEFATYTQFLINNDLTKDNKKHIEKMIKKIEENEFEN